MWFVNITKSLNSSLNLAKGRTIPCLPVKYSQTMCGLLLSSSDKVTTTLKWSSAHLSPFTQAFSHPSIIISVSLYSSVLTFPSSLIQSLTYSLSFYPVFHCLARPLFRGCGSAGHQCAMSFSERSQEFSIGAEPPLSFFICSPVFPLPRLLSLCLSPSITPYPHSHHMSLGDWQRPQRVRAGTDGIWMVHSCMKKVSGWRKQCRGTLNCELSMTKSHCNQHPLRSHTCTDTPS